jgi:hypothetical protein
MRLGNEYLMSGISITAFARSFFSRERSFQESQFASEDDMKRLLVIGGIYASLQLGAAGTAFAQDDHKNDRQQTAQPENRHDQARPQEPARPEDRRNQEPQSGNRHETTPQSEGRPEQQPQSGDRHPQTRENDRQKQPQDRQDQDRQNPERPNMQKPQEREQERHDQPRPEAREQGRVERPHENRRRIPDSDFHAHFGREHRFAPKRVQVYEGRPQFNYGGYVFEIVEVWPAGWGYDDDDYYIDYVDDEYWLYSFRHPGVRLELIIIG